MASYTSEYIISVIDPKSDIDKKINGIISFIEEPTRIGSLSTLKGLPNPWTNAVTNTVVTNNTGEISYNIDPKIGTTKEQLSNDTIIALQNIILDTYGVSLLLQYSDPKYTNTTSLISNTGSTSSITTSTASLTTTEQNKLQEFVFNVELQDVFYNQNTGNLYILTQEESINLIDNGESDILDAFTESTFSGDEEVALHLEYDKFPQSIENIDSTGTPYDSQSPEVIPVKVHIDGNSWYAVAANFISKKEGFLATAKWDVNHYRAGYGTQYKLVGSNLVEVTSTTTFTLQEAINTLQYQLKQDYEPLMIKSFGSSEWQRLNKNQKAAIVSLAYNCGPYIYTTGGAASRAYARTVKQGVASNNANLISKGIASGPITGGGRVLTALVTRRSEEAGLALA